MGAPALAMDMLGSADRSWLITVQYWRGVPSHFNDDTALDRSSNKTMCPDLDGDRLDWLGLYACSRPTVKITSHELRHTFRHDLVVAVLSFGHSKPRHWVSGTS